MASHKRKEPSSAASAHAAAAAASSLSLNRPEKKPKIAPDLSSDMMKTLSVEQRAVLAAILRGENVFFSGNAGTGKSYLIQLLPRILQSGCTFYTASTGIAAVAIGGTTLHSFAGVGLGDGTKEQLVQKVRGNKKAMERWEMCKTLVVDEVSMLDGNFLDKLDYVARKVKKNAGSFGGIQLVLCGDFLQLPPVKVVVMAFQSEMWSKCFETSIMLRKIFRQEGDQTFIDLLSNLRQGQLTLKQEALLKKAQYTKVQTPNGVEPTKLFATKESVRTENETRLADIKSPSIFFKSKDKFEAGYEAQMELLKKECPAAETIELKVGAQVILLKNLDLDIGLCSGRRGVVTHVIPNPEAGSMPTRLPFVTFENGLKCLIQVDKFDVKIKGHEVACRHQIPLALAWALTIHKSQGMTLETAEINASRIFEKGQLYVAVSRVKSLQGLKLINFTRECMKTELEIVKWYEKLEADTKDVAERLLQQQ